MSAETLAEQVSKIKAGDHVKARFNRGGHTYTIEGEAYKPAGESAWLGEHCLDGKWGPVEIIEHTPAKPAWHDAQVIKARLTNEADLPPRCLLRRFNTGSPMWVDQFNLLWLAVDLTDVEVIVP